MSNLTVKENWMIIKEQAQAVKDAGLLPQNMTAAQAAIIVMKGQELGIGTMRALEGLYVVNGKIGMSASLVMGLIRERCPKATINVKTKNDKGCIIEATRPGQPTELFSFTEKDAHAAGLIKPNSPWTKYAASMYWARCVTNMGRQLFSDVLGSPYSPEELGGEVEKEIHEQPKIIDTKSSQNTPIQVIKKENKPTSGLSLGERINKAKETVKEEKVIKSTRDVKTEKRFVEKTLDGASIVVREEVPVDDIALFEDFGTSDKPDILMVDNSPDITHWDRIATSGSYEGQSFKKIFQSLGKEKFFALYSASVKSIAKMQQEGKPVSQNTTDTFKDLESCLKELGMA